MRICLISREYPPDTGWGGVGVYTFHTANILSEQGHDVHVITLAGNGKQSSVVEYKGVKIHRVDWEGALDELNLFLVACPSSHFIMKSGIAIWKEFLLLHQKKPFDLVEAPEHLAAGVFHALTQVAPVVVTLHTPHSKFVKENFHFVTPNFDNQLICLLERMAIRQADLIASPSEDLANFVSSDTGIAKSEIEIYKNPVDTKLFHPEGSKCFESSKNVRVVFVGRLEERKGVQILVSAIPEVVSQVPNVEFVIVGADTDTAPGGKSMKGYLESSLKAHNCLDKVSFVSHIPIEEMPSYYRSGDISVIPSLYDNAPYTCIEALSSGKPVVVSDSGGTKEYVQDGKTGFVVQKSEPKQLADAIVKLAGDKAMRDQFGDASRKYAEEHLDLKVYLDKKELLYKEAIERYKDRSNKSVYGLSAKDSLMDSVDLLCSFDNMIFETLHGQSIDFRLRYWFRLLKKRPKLALLKTVVSFLECSFKLVGKSSNESKLLVKLNEQIEARSGNAFELTRVWAQLSQETDIEIDAKAAARSEASHPSARVKSKIHS